METSTPSHESGSSTVSSSSHARSSRRFLVWVPVWIGTAIALFYALENWRGRRVWNAYVAGVIARGDSLDPSAVASPPVPDAENFALAPPFQELYGSSVRYWDQLAVGQRLRKFSRMRGNLRRPAGFGWRVGRFIDLAAWRTYFRNWPDWPSSSATQSLEEDVLTVLSFYDKEVAEIRAADARPHSRFPLRYGTGDLPDLKHLSLIGNLIWPIQLRCSAHLAADDTETAFQGLLLGIRLSEAIKDEPFLASVLLRGSWTHVWTQQFWEGLARHQWSEPQLVTFEQRLSAINLAEHFQRSIQGERNVVLLPSLERYQQAPGKMWNGLGFDRNLSEWLNGWFSGQRWKDELGEAALELIPSGWFDQNKVAVGRALDRLRESVDPKTKRFFPERSNVFEEELIKIGGRGFSPYTAFSKNFNLTAPSVYHGTLTQLAEAQAFVNLVRIAIALERHRLRRGDYPDTLVSMESDVLPNGGVPRDPASGTDPHYMKLPNGIFTLYYDGWNGIDDGGVTAWRARPTYPDRMNGDWVWPLPAR